jgi:hypothetical protein
MASVNWTNVDFLTDLYRTVLERQYATFNNFRVEDIYRFQVGQNACSIYVDGLKSIYQIIINLSYGTASVSNADGGLWIHPDAEVDGVSNMPFITIADYEAALGGHAPTHKFPKEFIRGPYFPTTQWQDGSPIADGDIARDLSDGLIYKRLGGQWVLSDEKLPQLVTIYKWALLDLGEVVGPWIFEEIQILLNMMKRFARPVKTDSTHINGVSPTMAYYYETYARNGQSRIDNWSSLADAEANADSNWTPVSSGPNKMYTNVRVDFTYQVNTFPTGTPTNFQYSQVTKNLIVSKVALEAGKWLNRTVEFLAKPTVFLPMTDGAGGTDTPNDIWVEGQYKRWDTKSGTGTLISNFSGETSIPSVNECFTSLPPTNVNHSFGNWAGNATRGYTLGQFTTSFINYEVYVVVRLDVEDITLDVT